MNLAQQFNALNETTVNRKTLDYLLARAEKERHALIQKRIVKVLKAYPEKDEFTIKLVSLIEPYGLNGADLDLFETDTYNEETTTGLNGIPQQDIYNLVTDKIIENLENSKNWDSGQIDTKNTHIVAINFLTKKPYKGINQMLLGGNPLLGQMLENPYYLTFNQVEKLGGKINAGAKSKDAIFYTILYNYKGFKTSDKEKFVKHLRETGNFADNEIASAVYEFGYGIIRIYNVFNGKDITGIDFKLPPPAISSEIIVDKIPICETIINKYPAPKPNFTTGGTGAYYRNVGDVGIVNMPKVEVYKDIRTYYAVFFHELIHSTGHKDRLNRKFGNKFGDKNYAFEELVAEIGASFLSATAGFFYFTKENSKSYINGWRKAIVSYLKENNKGIFQASAKAQKAVDFMLTNVTEKDFETTEKIVINAQTPTKPANKTIETTVKNKKVVKPVKSNVSNLENNVKGFDLSKNTESNALMQSITDICKLDGNEKDFNKYRFVYNNFYLRNGNKFIKNQIIVYDDLALLKEFKIVSENELYDFEKIEDTYEFSLLSNGKKLIDRINNRLTSLENQKYNYSFFDGLKGVEISSEKFKKMKVYELREFLSNYYNKNLKGNSVEIKNHLKNVVFISDGGKKIQKPIYSEKVAVIESFEEIIKNAVYNNFGKRKPTDNPTILGYLNFKSKLTIDGQKRHVRINISLNEKRETFFKSYEVGSKEKKSEKTHEVRFRNPKGDGVNSLSNNKDNKNNTNIPNNIKNGLNAVAKNNSLAHKMANRKTNFNYFNVANKDISDFLGQIEIKEKESIVISLTGGQGSMKTRFAFQFMNALAQNYNCGHASIEEHPESKLYYDKVEQYLNAKALNNIEAPEIKSSADLHKLILANDVIIIDSYAKMQELEKGFEVDKDLRKKYNGKLFLVIFQQTTDGKMRGGSKSQFDADIVLFTEKKDDYKNNYIYADKNRYQSKSLDSLHFNIFSGKLNNQNENETNTKNNQIVPILKGSKLSFIVK